MKEMSYKDEVKRDLVSWNEKTQRIFFDVLRSVEPDIKEAVVFEMTTQRLAEFATHRDETLIRRAFESMVKVAKDRRSLLEELASMVGSGETYSKLDLDWVLRYGAEFYGENVNKAFSAERERVFHRMKSAGLRHRVNSILANISEENDDNQSEASE